MRPRPFALAAALCAAPALAHAQSESVSRVFNGCDLYACATLTVGESALGLGAYAVNVGGFLTLLDPAVSGAYTRVDFVHIGTDAFSGDPGDCEDASFADGFSLVGHAAGDVIAVHAPGCVRRGYVPISVATYGGALLNAGGAYTGQNIAPTLTATPEPTAVALAAVGLAGLGAAAGWRRRTGRQATRR